MPLAAAFHLKHHIALLVHHILFDSVLSPATVSGALMRVLYIVPVQCSRTCALWYKRKQLYRLLRAGNIQIHHLQDEQSHSECPGA